MPLTFAVIGRWFARSCASRTSKGFIMAQKTQVILVDDIDNGPATQTVTFGIDGVTYEIDLNDEHAAALREPLAEVAVAHPPRPAARPRRFVSGLVRTGSRSRLVAASPLRFARPTSRPTPDSSPSLMTARVALALPPEAALLPGPGAGGAHAHRTQGLALGSQGLAG